MPDRYAPDYDLDETVEITTPRQLSALGNPARFRILGLLSERAASTTELSKALGTPKGTVAHHLKVLEDAGLVKVVRTRQVRAMTERYYGRVGQVSVLKVEGSPSDSGLTLQQAIAEIAASPDPEGTVTSFIRHARIPESKAKRFAERLERLANEFDGAVEGERVYGVAAALWLSDWPALPAVSAEAEGPGVSAGRKVRRAG